jgi:hypothetical protein
MICIVSVQAYVVCDCYNHVACNARKSSDLDNKSNLIYFTGMFARCDRCTLTQWFNEIHCIEALQLLFYLMFLKVMIK